MGGKRLQLKRGTTAQTSTFTGLNGEVTVDTTKKTLVVHDGATIGGTVLAKASDVALKVDKVAGKQLSTEDYSTTEKSKLAGISAGAQVNVPTDLSLGTITGSTITLNSSTGSDVVFPSATTSAAGLLSGTDKIKLDSISANANNYTHPTSGVGAGIYKSVTVDVNGHVTGGTNPTTLAGYSITDAYTKTETNTALAMKVNNSEKGSANGVATLDVNGKVVLTQIPDSILGQLEYMGTYSFSGGMPTATQKGQYWIASADGNGYIAGDWAVWNGTSFDKVDNTDAVATVAGRTGNVVLTKNDVGLANVDNTSDANKPVSTATQTALNLKADIASPTFTGTVTAPTFSGSLSGNAATVTNGVYTTGNQTIAGVKTFSSSPVVPAPTTDFQSVPLKSTNITVNVGTGQTYTTINQALEYLSGFYPMYKQSGITATINLKAGFVMAEQVLVSGIDLGWITIVGEDAETIITHTALTTAFYGSNYPVFGVDKGGTSPVIGQLFRFNVEKVGGNKHGLMTLGAGSSADVLADKGFIGAGAYGIFAHSGSTINANNTNCSNAGAYGIFAHSGSTINAVSANCSNAGTTGICAYSGATISAVSANCSNAGAYGIFAHSGSTINANNTNCSNAGAYGIFAANSSTISAVSAIVQNQTTGNARVLVSAGSTINVYGIDATGGTVPVFSQAVNTLTGSGIIYQ